MSKRHSTVPNLDLSSFSLDKDVKKSSPLTPDGQGPLTPHTSISSPTSPCDTEPAVRPATQDSGGKSDSPSFTGSSPTTNFNPSLTAIPQYPPSPKDSPKHNREASKSFFANLKAPKSSHRVQKSDSSGHLPDKPKSCGGSRDRRTQILSKPYESSPDLVSTVLGPEQNEQC